MTRWAKSALSLHDFQILLLCKTSTVCIIYYIGFIFLFYTFNIFVSALLLYVTSRVLKVQRSSSIFKDFCKYSRHFSVTNTNIILSIFGRQCSCLYKVVKIIFTASFCSGPPNDIVHGSVNLFDSPDIHPAYRINSDNGSQGDNISSTTMVENKTYPEGKFTIFAFTLLICNKIIIFPVVFFHYFYYRIVAMFDEML